MLEQQVNVKVNEEIAAFDQKHTSNTQSPRQSSFRRMGEQQCIKLPLPVKRHIDKLESLV